jgi:hypothetical protein
MCRSTIDGGRRCPSHTDPLLISNRNARRRAKYAEKHKKAGTPNIPERVSHATSAFIKEHTLFKEASNSYEVPLSNLYAKSTDGEDSAIGVSTEEYQGLLVDNGYIAKSQNSGQINYTKLDHESYLDFGFQDPNEQRESHLKLDELKKLSEAELADIPLGEQKALAYFTGDDYEWINMSLYGKTYHNGTPALVERADDAGEMPDLFNNEAYSKYDKLGANWEALQEENASPEVLKIITDKVDSAMLKAPGQQRILYRGMSKSHEAFDKYSSVSKFVAKNYPLGQEVKFDGYQSTSYSPLIADTYCGDGEGNGLMFEIKAASGINLTSISEYATEEEVLLPRDARYMVVGIHEGVSFDAAGPNGKQWAKNPNTTIVQLVEITEDGYVRTDSNLSSPKELSKEQLKAAPNEELKDGPLV